MIRFILISLLFGIISCKRSSIPSEIIKQAEMQQILWDVLRANALAQHIAAKDSSKSFPAETMKYTKEVFAIHQITDSQFQQSYTYYIHNPNMMKEMFDSIQAQQTRQPLPSLPKH